MKTSTPSKQTSGQETKYRRLVEDAAKKAVDLVLSKNELDQDSFQRLLENGNELCGSITETIVTRTRELSLSDRFADEEVSSTWTYPKEYKGPKPIEEQIKALATIFNLDPAEALAYAKNLPQLPEGAEGWFAILSPSALFPEIKDPAERYCRSVQLAHEKIKATRAFYNYREGQIDKAHLRVHPRTAQMVSQLAEQQRGGILIVAAQLGMSHRGQSTRRAREVFKPNEFGLGSLAGCSIVLVHPERLVRYEELDMDLPGDEFNHPGGEAPFILAPFLRYYDGEVYFGTMLVSFADDNFGSASGFVPQ